MNGISREDVAKAVHHAYSLVTEKPLPDGMATIGGPRGDSSKIWSWHRVRKHVRDLRIELTLEMLPLDGYHYKTVTLTKALMSKNGASMTDALCEALGIKETEPCN